MAAKKAAPRNQDLLPENVADRLLAVGLAEISAAGDLLAEEDLSARATTRALSESARGIELIVKSLVAREHWSHVFEDPANASVSALAAGDFKSATIDDCIERLVRLTGFEIEERERRHLKAMRLRRNLYEHLGQMENVAALRGAMGAALHVLVEVLKEADAKGLLPEDAADAPAKLAVELSRFDRFTTARLNDLRPQLKGQSVFECPHCLQEAALVEDGLNCLFCVVRSPPEIAARHFVENKLGVSNDDVVRGDATWPVFTCPNCDADALVQFDAVEPGGDGFICFSCNETWKPDRLERCVYCDRMVHTDDENGSMCSECWSDQMSRD
jgi:hypothetical protein